MAGACPIPLRDVVQWLDFEGIESMDVRREFAGHVAAMDDVWLAHSSKKAA